ncbi:acetyl-CoA synthetase-like protein [Gonapodya prolifera JEL478]|uniref:Acetyl-CoA synthetase-like protein n=1 Tax=Gonapodya prolifera (strain JEL478) TaxID=1344416 RepID=A0A139AP60_GONPJ|nr:acetyl-CoA synthetase-like protein [Gonapodya prolifera JEL478]|eukprot:KXS18530.1 acetyl-CoA synthetase-like protein [Gonapodya prolifera JEL478]
MADSAAPAVAAPASLPSLEECHRAIMEEDGGICETQFEQIEWHTGKILWHRTFKNSYSNLRQYWEDAVAKHGPREYLIYECPFTKVEDRWTYNQTAEKVKSLANALSKDYGVTKGDRIAIAMRNYPEWIVAFWAAQCLGAIPAMVNAWLVTDELAYCITLADVKVAIIDSERYDRLAPRIPDLKRGGVSEFILARASSSQTGPRRGGYPGTVSWESVLGKRSSAKDKTHLAPVEILPDDNCTILFTSGTTGRPKAALGSHRNFITNQWVAMFSTIRGCMRANLPVPPQPLGPDVPQTANLLVVPLFHVTAVSILGSTTLNGGKLVIAYKFEPADTLRIIEKERVNIMGGVPSMIMMLVEHPDAKSGKRDLSSFMGASFGGAPSHPGLALNFAKVFKGSPGTAWGMTEASPLATTISGMDFINYPDSAGIPHPLNEIIVCDPETLRELPKGEIGEFLIRGVNIIKGYWRNPEATKQAFLPNGFYKTGDVGYIDPKTGYIYIKDRIKDMLIRGGENIYCQEIEDAIFTHPGVLDCTIVGVPHRILGEEPAAIIVQKPSHPNLTPADVISHIRPKIAAFKIPVFVHIQNEEIPRNANGKVQKGILKKEVAGLWEQAKATSKSKL